MLSKAHCNGHMVRRTVIASVPTLDDLGYEIPRWLRTCILTFVAILPLTFPAFWALVARPMIKDSVRHQPMIVADDQAGSLIPSAPTTITGAFIFIALAMSASQTYIIKRQFDGMDRRDERYGNVATVLGQQAKNIEELHEIIDELKEQVKEIARERRIP